MVLDTVSLLEMLLQAAGDGFGLFEHASFGRHDPSGFTGWESVAP